MQLSLRNVLIIIVGQVFQTLFRTHLADLRSNSLLAQHKRAPYHPFLLSSNSPLLHSSLLWTTASYPHDPPFCPRSRTATFCTLAFISQNPGHWVGRHHSERIHPILNSFNELPGSVNFGCQEPRCESDCCSALEAHLSVRRDLKRIEVSSHQPCRTACCCDSSKSFRFRYLTENLLTSSLAHQSLSAKALDPSFEPACE